MKIANFAMIFLVGGMALVRGDDAAGFKQAEQPRVFSFPADHASHAGFQTEWWYVTGNVRDDAGRRYGYQFTIFRRAIDARDAAARGRTSAWAAGDVYLLHVAVSAVDDNSHVSEEAMQRGVLGVAGATEFETAKSAKAPEELKVWMKGAEFVRSARGWKLKAQTASLALDFDLAETLAPVLHGVKGEAGMSRKGPRPGQASYYYSVPFLKTTGTLTFKNRRVKITQGHSWMDHEFGSNQLSAEQSGWVWISIHLDDGRALMLYVLRNRDGSIEPRSSGTWIEKDGTAAHLALADFALKPGRMWKNPQGGEYALEWSIEIPGHAAKLKLSAAMDDQEFRSAQGGMNYYEGAANIEGTVGGGAVKGEGYLEITSGAMGGRM